MTDQPFDPIEIICRLAHNIQNASKATVASILPPTGEIYYAYDDAPAEMRESLRDGVVAILEGQIRCAADTHNRWLEFKESQGWTYGPTKSIENKTHPCMLPYTKLPSQDRLKDSIFFETVTHLIEMLGARPSLED